MIKRIPHSFFIHTPAMLFGILSIYLFITGFIPLGYMWISFVMWILVSGLGIAVGYHRVFSHKTHALPIWKENIILFFAVFAAQGSSIFWTAVHRGNHHRFADTDADVHSPNTKNFLESFLLWHYKLNSENLNLRYAVDLLRKPNHLWFHKNNILIFWSVPILVALFDPALSLAMFCLPMFVGNMQDNFVNVIGHKKWILGYRNFETKDMSYNHPIVGFLTWGQSLHNNHHNDPKRFDFGNKWWEIDPCRIFYHVL